MSPTSGSTQSTLLPTLPRYIIILWLAGVSHFGEFLEYIIAHMITLWLAGVSHSGEYPETFSPSALSTPGSAGVTPIQKYPDYFPATQI